MKYQVKTIVDSSNIVEVVNKVKAKVKSSNLDDKPNVILPTIIGEYEYDEKEQAIEAATNHHKETNIHCEVLRISTIYQTNASNSDGLVIDF